MRPASKIGFLRENAIARPELMVTAILICALTGLVGFEYSSFQKGEQAARARADLRRILPPADDFFADNGTYRGMTLERLRKGYDTGLPTSRYELESASGNGFCVEAMSGSEVWHASGPADEIGHGPCRTGS
jgi:hypothetical protein